MLGNGNSKVGERSSSHSWMGATGKLRVDRRGWVRSSESALAFRACTTPPNNVQEAAGGFELSACLGAAQRKLPPARSANPECQDQECSSRRRLPRLQCCGQQPQLTNRRRKLLTSPDSINDIRSIGRIRILYHPVANSLRAPLSPHFWYLS